MDNLLQGILNVCVCLDDILVTGCADVNHLQNLTEVLCRMGRSIVQDGQKQVCGSGNLSAFLCYHRWNTQGWIQDF